MSTTEHDELVENYEALRTDRGWSVGQMADHIETGDPALAARYREQAAGKKAAKSEATEDEPKTAAPKGRRGAAKSDG